MNDKTIYLNTKKTKDNCLVGIATSVKAKTLREAHNFSEPNSHISIPRLNEERSCEE